MMSNPHDPNANWRYCHIETVRFADCDMFHHLNNAKYLTYVESARVAYYTHITGMQNPRDFDMTVARAEIDYKKPVFYPSKVSVYTRAVHIGNKSWTLEHELRDSETGDLYARCTTVLVHFDHETGISKPIPAEIVAKIEAHEGRPLKAPMGQTP